MKRILNSVSIFAVAAFLVSLLGLTLPPTAIAADASIVFYVA
jgi:hypothetical protein